MNMNTTRGWLAAGLVAFGLVAVVPPADAKIRVVATTQDLAYFARVIGNGEADASSILKGFQDPHFAAAKPSFMVEVSRADVLLSLGLDLEIGWLPLIVTGARNPSVMPGQAGFVDCSQFVTPIEVPAAGADRSKGDLHPKGNPHYWLDPENAKKLARGIADRMTQVDPGDAAAFAGGLAKLLAEIDQADAGAKALFAGSEIPPVVTYHVTFSYFFERYGIRPAGFIETKPGIPPTPGHVASLVTQLKALGKAPAIIVEPYYDMEVPRQLGAQVGGRVELTPSSIGGTDEARTYKDLIVTVARKILGK